MGSEKQQKRITHTQQINDIKAAFTFFTFKTLHSTGSKSVLFGANQTNPSLRQNVCVISSGVTCRPTLPPVSTPMRKISSGSDK